MKKPDDHWTPEDWALFRRFLFFLVLFIFTQLPIRYWISGVWYRWLLARELVGADELVYPAFLDSFSTAIAFLVAVLIMPPRAKPEPARDEESGWSR